MAGCRLAATLSSVSRDRAAMTRPVLVVDTDTASDDAVALLLAALSPDAELVAVTTVAGNVPVEQATRNALITLDLGCAGHVPVFAGCDRPMVRPFCSAQHVHGRDGMGETELAEPRSSAQAEHGCSGCHANTPPDRSPSSPSGR